MDEIDKMLNEILHPKPVNPKPLKEYCCFAFLLKILKCLRLEAKNVHYLIDGVTGTIRFHDGNDYEVTIKPKIGN